MLTSIELDDKLVKEALKYSTVKNKKDLITMALKEFVETHKRKDLSDLKGKISFGDDYDYKKLREGV